MKIQYNSKFKSEITGLVCFQGKESQYKSYFGNKKFEAKCGESFFAPAQSGQSAALIIGLGKEAAFNLQKARKAAAKLIVTAKSFRMTSASFEMSGFDSKASCEDLAKALVEGARLSTYRFDKYKSKPAPKSDFTDFVISCSRVKNESSVKKAIAEAELVCEGVYFTRNIANEPANVINPESLAKIAQTMAKENNLLCQILLPEQMKKLGMGGILGVCQGSSYEPRLVVLENKVKSSKPPIVLVGKGVTFDTGGISIKPSNDMDKMKFDMSGAAAVMGAMKAIANLKIPVRVIGITPLVENMPGSKAQRPGDIVRFMNGKTAEVLNTDAEGRLILADALCYAEKFRPKTLINIATLTGACAAAFGDICSGVMSTDPELVKELKEVGDKTGERLWELPLWDDYFELIRATYADIQNISKKNAGAITAGMFLKEFTGHTKSWAHLDVAGTAWADSAKPLSPIGNTGVGVRLFVEYVQSQA